VKVSDRLTGLILLVLGAFTYYGGSLLPPVPGQQVGPDVFPMVIGASLAVCGLLIIFGVGSTFEEGEKVVLTAEGEVVEANVLEKEATGLQGFLQHGWKVLIPPGALFFYYFASEKLGFWITASLMILALSRSQGAKWKGAILLSVFAPIFVHLVFYKLLRVPLPEGLLKFPWA
jgi:putative tricarboxylic transport membrane protein